jgi:hypothetical protein
MGQGPSRINQTSDLLGGGFRDILGTAIPDAVRRLADGAARTAAVAASGAALGGTVLVQGDAVALADGYSPNIDGATPATPALVIVHATFTDLTFDSGITAIIVGESGSYAPMDRLQIAAVYTDIAGTGVVARANVPTYLPGSMGNGADTFTSLTFITAIENPTLSASSVGSDAVTDATVTYRVESILLG